MPLQLVHRSELRAPWGLLRDNADWAILSTYTSNHGTVVASGTKPQMEKRITDLDVPERHMPRLRILIQGATWEDNKIARCEALRTSGQLRVHVTVALRPAFTVLAVIRTPEDYRRACRIAESILTGKPILTVTVNEDPEPTFAAQIVCTGNAWWLAWLDGTEVKRRKFATEADAEEHLAQLAAWHIIGPDTKFWLELAEKARLDPAYRVATTGELYHFPPMSESRDTKMLGHGGSIFTCSDPAGSTQRSNNVSWIGLIPACALPLFPAQRYEIAREPYQPKAQRSAA